MRTRGSVWKVRPRSRAGEPIADLVFVFMFGNMLKEVHNVLMNAENGWMLAFNESYFVEARAREHTAQENEEACADDCVYLLRHEDPEKLLAVVRFTTEEFCKAAERHGLKVNFGVAKTEALVVLRGVGRNKVKNEIKGKNLTLLVAGQELRIVEQYKHMGSMCTPSGAMGPEVSWRMDRTRVTYLAVAGRFFAAANFSLNCMQEECGYHAPGDAPSLQQ